MSRELDALNKIFEIAVRRGGMIVYMRPDYEIVKSALERKEKLEKVWKTLKKSFVVGLIDVSDDYCDFKYNCGEELFITEEEFNLLKEELRND